VLNRRLLYQNQAQTPSDEKLPHHPHGSGSCAAIALFPLLSASNSAVAAASCHLLCVFPRRCNSPVFRPSPAPVVSQCACAICMPTTTVAHPVDAACWCGKLGVTLPRGEIGVFSLLPANRSSRCMAGEEGSYDARHWSTERRRR
jgi:hypothetical protein